MRRPHPRFDSVRDAWVTRAGGRIKILAKGPKNAARILATSGLADGPPKTVAAPESAVNGFLGKPYTTKELVRAVRKILEAN